MKFYSDDRVDLYGGDSLAVHGQRIGCCAGCRHLFSSDTAFNAHRRVGQCLDPRGVGLVGRPSRTAPGEVIWAFPASDVPWGER